MFLLLIFVTIHDPFFLLSFIVFLSSNFHSLSKIKQAKKWLCFGHKQYVWKPQSFWNFHTTNWIIYSYFFYYIVMLWFVIKLVSSLSSHLCFRIGCKNKKLNMKSLSFFFYLVVELLSFCCWCFPIFTNEYCSYYYDYNFH